jgi:hypothetical protein
MNYQFIGSTMYKTISFRTISVLIALYLFCFDAGAINAQKTDSTNYITFSKIDTAWKYSKGTNATVAVIDWLFDLSPDAAKKYIHSASMVPGGEVGSSEPWHGEWMACIIHTIAPEAKIIPIRGNPGREEPIDGYLIKAIRYAADNGAAAVTNSMGPVQQTKELTEAIEYAWKKGTIFIDVHPEYISKTEKGYQWCKPDELNNKIIHAGIVSVPKYEDQPDPARDINTWPYEINPKFRDGWGYSNAPPQIAGVIALMKSVNKELTPEDLKNIILSTAVEINGFKVLNAEAAVKEAIKRK